MPRAACSCSNASSAARASAIATSGRSARARSPAPAGSGPAPSGSGPGRTRRSPRAGTPAGRPSRSRGTPVRGQRGDGDEVVARDGPSRTRRAARSDLGFLGVARGEMHVDEERQQRRGRGAGRVDLRQARARGHRAPARSRRARGGSPRVDGASTLVSASIPSSSCCASSRRPWRTRRSARRTSAPWRRPTAGRAPKGVLLR